MSHRKRLITLFICLMMVLPVLASAESTADFITASDNQIYTILSTVLSDPATHTEIINDSVYQSSEEWNHAE